MKPFFLAVFLFLMLPLEALAEEETANDLNQALTVQQILDNREAYVNTRVKVVGNLNYGLANWQNLETSLDLRFDKLVFDENVIPSSSSEPLNYIYIESPKWIKDGVGYFYYEMVEMEGRLTGFDCFRESICLLLSDIGEAKPLGRGAGVTYRFYFDDLTNNAFVEKGLRHLFSRIKTAIENDDRAALFSLFTKEGFRTDDYFWDRNKLEEYIRSFFYSDLDQLKHRAGEFDCITSPPWRSSYFEDLFEPTRPYKILKHGPFDRDSPEAQDVLFCTTRAGSETPNWPREYADLADPLGMDVSCHLVVYKEGEWLFPIVYLDFLEFIIPDAVADDVSEENLEFEIQVEGDEIVAAFSNHDNKPAFFYYNFEREGPFDYAPWSIEFQTSDGTELEKRLFSILNLQYPHRLSSQSMAWPPKKSMLKPGQIVTRRWKIDELLRHKIDKDVCETLTDDSIRVKLQGHIYFGIDLRGSISAESRWFEIPLDKSVVCHPGIKVLGPEEAEAMLEAEDKS